MVVIRGQLPPRPPGSAQRTEEDQPIASDQKLPGDYEPPAEWFPIRGWTWKNCPPLSIKCQACCRKGLLVIPPTMHKKGKYVADHRSSHFPTRDGPMLRFKVLLNLNGYGKDALHPESASDTDLPPEDAPVAHQPRLAPPLDVKMQVGIGGCRRGKHIGRATGIPMFGTGAGIDDIGGIGSMFAPLPYAHSHLTPH